MIKLSEHFNYKKLLLYTLPSIIMLVFTSIYGVADGFFVSNFVGKGAFAAVNFIMPYLMILGCVGFLFGTGGSALIAKIIGEGDNKRANGIFSMIVCVSFICGAVLMGVGIVTLRPVAKLMGGTGEMLENAIVYGRIILFALPAYVLQYEFQCLFATAEKTRLGLYVTVAAGLTNFALDGLFVAAFKWGLVGAAVATVIGQCVGGIIPVIYFILPNSSLLRLTKPKFELKSLLKTVANGSSELMSNITMSLVGMIYNLQLLKFAGEDGVAAYGVLMYVNFVFQAIFIGYTVGVAPIVSYNFGAGNSDELKSLNKKNLILIAIFSLLMFGLAELLGGPIAKIFVGYDVNLYEMTARAFMIFSVLFLFSGFNILGSSFFTALNNGLISAAISFLRTLVFQIGAVMLLPMIWGLNGVWWSAVCAEVMAAIVTAIFMIAMRKKYQY